MVTYIYLFSTIKFTNPTTWNISNICWIQAIEIIIRSRHIASLFRADLFFLLSSYQVW